MKVIIAGSRDITNPAALDFAITASQFEIAEVVCGCARGADTLGEQWAIAHNIPVKRFPADWKKHGKAAGALRNIEMGNYGDALIALWDGRSRGTKSMIDYAKRRGLKVHVHLQKC